MPKVKLTITDSKCRCGYFAKGQEFLVEDLCPPLCHELWNSIIPLSMHCKTARCLTMARQEQKCSMHAARMGTECVFMEKLWKTDRLSCVEKE